MSLPPTNVETHIATTEQQKNYNGIDVIKFLCAILVFAIHIPPFYGELSGFSMNVDFALRHCICRVAVPFYFMCAGFFLFGKMPLSEINTEKVKHYCFKVLRLLGTWHVLLFVGGNDHLWYLGATVIAVILVSLCFHFRLKKWLICLLAGFLYVLGLLDDSYRGLLIPFTDMLLPRCIILGYELVFITTRNGVFMGFIFVLMGAAFAHSKIRLKPAAAALGFIVSLVCLLAEAFTLKYHNLLREYNMYVFLVPAVYFLFSFACSLRLKDRSLYKHLRNIGVLTYFLHLFVTWFVVRVTRTLDSHLNLFLTQYIFVFSLVPTILVSAFIEYLSRKDKFKWINWLIR